MTQLELLPEERVVFIGTPAWDHDGEYYEYHLELDGEVIEYFQSGFDYHTVKTVLDKLQIPYQEKIKHGPNT